MSAGRRNLGGTLLPALLALALLGALGAWNYRANRELENAEPRPYRGLREPDLAALGHALEAEIGVYVERYQRATGRRVEVRSPQLLGDQIREFERVQSISESTRQIGRELSEREGSLRRVRQEQRKRDEERDRVRLFLRRLLAVR